MGTIISHPRFAVAPVQNPRTRGRPKGTLSFRVARRRASERQASERNAEELARPARAFLSDLLLQRAPTLNVIECSHVKMHLTKALEDIDTERKARADGD